MTPFKALYGREPPILIRGDMIHSSVEEVNRLMADRNHMLDKLKEHLVQAQNRILAKKVNQKLSPRYYGPYEIIEKFSPAAYRLQLPPGSKVHPVFHVSALKKSIAATITSQPLPLFLADDWELKVQPADALAVRRNQQGEIEILIRWKDLPDFKNSWEARFREAEKCEENSILPLQKSDSMDQTAGLKLQKGSQVQLEDVDDLEDDDNDEEAPRTPSKPPD
ncbi:hypothetical protein V8G54_030569 [Vigna mungo]|uniref:Chromo domain-containing protein n=1 Tax=Vigna mungo TaxID=3915 RepID=A0AAQ3RK75_VIGMU